jgi:hypothetical protein
VSSASICDLYLNIRRTKESVQELLSGFLEGSGVDKLSIPINSYLYGGNPCAKKVKYSYQDQPNYLRAEKTLKSEEIRLQSIMGKDYVPSFDILSSRFCHSKPLPCNKDKCITAKEYKTYEAARALVYQLVKQDPAYYTFAGANILKHVLPNFQQAKKMFIYSAHDTTLANLAAYLRIPDFLWPPFASNLILEIWNVRDVDQMRIIFHGIVIQTILLEEFHKQTTRDIQKMANCKF